MLPNLSELKDEEIVTMVCAKDKEIYAEIIRRYQARLIRYATYIIGDEHIAHDVVQDGFIKAYINLKGFNINKKFSSWIYRIVHNEAVNVINKNKKQVVWDNNFDITGTGSLEEGFIKAEIIKRTHGCLEQMPLIYKDPTTLYFLEEKSYEEISDILRIPVSTVGTRISRAKVLLKNICQKNK